MSSPNRFFVPGVVLALAAGVVPARGQQPRVEITTRRLPRAELSDSADRQFRRLRRQVDSLSSLYNDSDDLSATDRRRVGLELTRAVEQIADLTSRVADGTMELRLRALPSMAERASSMSRALMQMHSAAVQAAPRGWIGLVAEGPGMEPRFEGGELIIRYLSYPRIISVDPSGPAQRAGLIAGDTLLAYDGLDVSENDISLSRFRPKARIMVRVRRDAHVREFPVIVAEAPQRIMLRRDDEVRAPREPWIIAGVPNAPGFPQPAMPPMAPGMTIRTTMAPPAPGSPPIPTRALTFNFVAGGVAGMQLSTITEGLAHAIGVTSGVLVTRVPVGSLAGESGVADGDVIVKVAGQPVRREDEVRALVGLASQNGEHAVELEIVRDKRTQKLMLRW